MSIEQGPEMKAAAKADLLMDLVLSGQTSFSMWTCGTLEDEKGNEWTADELLAAVDRVRYFVAEETDVLEKFARHAADWRRVRLDRTAPQEAPR